MKKVLIYLHHVNYYMSRGLLFLLQCQRKCNGRRKDRPYNASRKTRPHYTTARGRPSGTKHVWIHPRARWMLIRHSNDAVFLQLALLLPQPPGVAIVCATFATATGGLGSLRSRHHVSNDVPRTEANWNATQKRERAVSLTHLPPQNVTPRHIKSNQVLSVCPESAGGIRKRASSSSTPLEPQNLCLY